MWEDWEKKLELKMSEKEEKAVDGDLHDLTEQVKKLSINIAELKNREAKPTGFKPQQQRKYQEGPSQAVMVPQPQVQWQSFPSSFPAASTGPHQQWATMGSHSNKSGLIWDSIKHSNRWDHHTSTCGLTWDFIKDTWDLNSPSGLRDLMEWDRYSKISSGPRQVKKILRTVREEKVPFLREICGKLPFRSKKNLVHAVSADFSMSAGIAREFKNCFGIPQDLDLIARGVGDVAVVTEGKRYIFHLITKPKYYQKPNPLHLKLALHELKRVCLEWRRISKA
ncbi:ADP-ribose glycohydrolase OARD1 [Frankliniella fusca]|uniref:ADP-ribose glycohydrolase OARD1 n=1 Tax=Frankliniella fusca TaxID=407009 RepID=A0AAE1LFA8_9NEOP|nr:ADP-ribose glycohydrolase OARD1 [Frankliniella fusca]